MEAAANLPTRQKPKRLKRTIIPESRLPCSVDSIIERIAQGQFLRDIAREISIDKRRLSELLSTDSRYKEAKRSSVIHQLEEGQVIIRDADDMTDIARGREMFKAAAWRAEREFPAEWGAKQQIEHVNSPVINFVFGGAPGDSARVIDSGATLGATVIESQDESK